MKGLAKAAFAVLFSLFLSFIISASAFATEQSPVVVGLDVSVDSVALFLSGKQPDKLSAKISGLDCEITYPPLESEKSDIRTLFLIDVSTSIRKNSRKQAADLLADLIANKKNGEQYAIAVFGETYRLLVDFTDDRYDLAKALDQVVWKDQASSIYDAVGTAVKELHKSESDPGLFTQLLVLSDGIEKSDDGIIKEELFFELKESPLPVHTIGFSYDNNSESLKELYAISRITGGFSHELDNKAEVLDAIDKLAGYSSEIYCVQLALPDQLKDGAVRPIELFENSDTQVLRYEVRMPSVEQTVVQAQPSQALELPALPEALPKQRTETSGKILIIALSIVGLLLAAGIVIFILLKKKRNNTESSKPEKAIVKNSSLETQFIGAEDNGTLFLIRDEHQQKMNESGFLLILNDLTLPHKRFEIIVEATIEIGRAPNQPGISIDYDRRISRRHCSISKQDEGLWIEDLGSANKTYVNDDMIRTPRMLRDNDVISCGKTKLSVRIERR